MTRLALLPPPAMASALIGTDGRSWRTEPLRSVWRRWKGTLRAAAPGGFCEFNARRGAPPYQVLVAPLPSGERIFTRARGGVLIALYDPSCNPVATADSLAYLLDLPKGAANVVKALLDGTELKDHAEESGISIHTVRFHLKTAFARTGAHSQSEIVRIAVLALANLGGFVSK